MTRTVLSAEQRKVLDRLMEAIEAGQALEKVVVPLVETKLPARVSLKSVTHRGGVLIEVRCEGIDSLEIMADIAKAFGERLHFDRGFVTTEVYVEAHLPERVWVQIREIFLTDEVRDFRRLHGV